MLLPERLVAFLFVAQAYDGWQILPWGHAHAMDGTIPRFDCAACDYFTFANSQKLT
jgi:hypothetical protein